MEKTKLNEESKMNWLSTLPQSPPSS